MLKLRLISAAFATILIANSTSAMNIHYCPGTQVTANEDIVMQKLVAEFSKEMNCEVGANCLLKWNIHDESEKFSIAWKNQCGPVIKGVYQLGDEGHGSTFVCEFKDMTRQSVCCWPLGYDYVKEFVICSGEPHKR